MNPQPDNGRSQAQRFLEEHDRLQRELMLTRDERDQLYRGNCDLASENELLKARLHQAEDRVAFLQGFSCTMITRFDMIKESVSALETAARENGIKVVKAPRLETAQEKKENAEAAAIVASLPHATSALPVNQFLR